MRIEGNPIGERDGLGCQIEQQSPVHAVQGLLRGHHGGSGSGAYASGYGLVICGAAYCELTPKVRLDYPST